MALRKCPRCELNYILNDGNLCSVCYEDVHGKVKREEAALLCSVCGEARALPGEDMCRACLDEMKASVEMNTTDDTEDDESVVALSALDDEPMSGLSEMEDIEGAGDDEIEEEDAEESLQEASGS